MPCYIVYSSVYFIVFFFKQKTAYEMRISDWSSDVCSSDLKTPVNDLCIGATFVTFGSFRDMPSHKRGCPTWPRFVISAACLLIPGSTPSPFRPLSCSACQRAGLTAPAVSPCPCSRG